MKESTLRNLLYLIFIAIIGVALTLLLLFYHRTGTTDEQAAVTEEEVIENVDTGEAIEATPEPVRDILVDVTDTQKLMFEYSETDLDVDALLYCANYTLETFSNTNPIEEDLIKQVYDNIYLTGTDGMIYLVCKADSDTLELRACTYADRVNPVYTASFTLSDGVWTLNG
ncbi:MAG: hypothetical protein NC548_11000 [Lachnospiraceae bacterium]|nr:hypothetical protein [Lachnospiraceae bacterium]